MDRPSTGDVRAKNWKNETSTSRIAPECRVSEAWEIPARSRLYQIEPECVGDAEVESLSGYVGGLAEEHCNWPSDLINYELLKDKEEERLKDKPDERKDPHQRFKFSRFGAINGWGPMTQQLISELESATLMTGFGALTLIPLKSVISRIDLFCENRRWCAICYEDRARMGIRIHDQLLWTLTAAEACPIHRVFLESNCPECDLRAFLFAAHGLPGFCARCSAWLGRTVSSTSKTADSITVWRARSVGELLAIMPRLPQQGLLAQFCRNVVEVLHAVPSAIRKPFRYIGHPGGGDKSVRFIQRPNLTQIIDLCHAAGVNITTLFASAPQMLLKFEDYQAEEIRLKKSRRMEVRNALERALTKNPIPSLSEIAGQLGMPTKTIMCWEPALSKEVASAHHGVRPRAKFPRKGHARSARLEEIEEFLKLEAKREPPRSLSEVAVQLGYKQADSIVRWFPELCAEIVLRYQCMKHVDVHKAERLLNQAETEDPIPSANVFAMRLGLSGAAQLRDRFPEIASRLNESRIRQREQRVQTEERRLLDILERAKQLTLKEVEGEAHLTRSQIRNRHPKIYRLIASCTRRPQRELAQRRRQELEEFVYTLVLNGLSPNPFPSCSEVRENIPEGLSKDHHAIRKALDSARARLSAEHSRKREAAEKANDNSQVSFTSQTGR
jgi:hypothetical protein